MHSNSYLSILTTLYTFRKFSPAFPNLPPVGVRCPPKGHKINLRSHKMIHVERRKNKVLHLFVFSVFGLSLIFAVFCEILDIVTSLDLEHFFETT